MATIFEKEQISVTDILNYRVSYQATAWSTICKDISIKDVLQEIRNKIHFQQVERLRSLLNSGDKEQYDFHKKNLPAVTFCGLFENERKKSALKHYNSLIVLDIDKLGETELQRIKQCLLNDPLVLAFWESPSQQGIKGLVHLSYNFELISANIDTAHKVGFKKLAKYFLESYNIELDKSGSDITRLCFLSYDPLIEVKDTVVSFEVAEPNVSITPEPKETLERIKPIHDGSRDALFNSKGRNDPKDRKTIQAIIRFLGKRNFSITFAYDEWYKVALAIANTFTYDVGEKYFLKLSSMDQAKFDAQICKKMLLYCYENQSGKISFKTIVYFANQKGYIIKGRREASSEAANEDLSQVSSS